MKEKKKDMKQNTKRSSRKTSIWPWILGLLAVVLALLLLRMGSGGKQSYQQTTAQRRDIVTYYTFSGNLTPVTDETQSAKTAFKVKELYVQEGDLVSQDQPLMRAADGTQILAKVSGTLETLSVEVDDVVQPGTPLAQIIDYSDLQVSVDVDEYDIASLYVGAEGEVLINALDMSMQGTVSEIARQATMEGGISFYPVKFQIEPHPDVRSGMSVEVRITSQMVKQALSLNLNVISYDESNKPYVLVNPDGRIEVRRYIDTGISDGVFVEILSGLSEQETVYYTERNTLRFFASGPANNASTGPANNGKEN